MRKKLFQGDKIFLAWGIIFMVCFAGCGSNPSASVDAVHVGEEENMDENKDILSEAFNAEEGKDIQEDNWKIVEIAIPEEMHDLEYGTRCIDLEMASVMGITTVAAITDAHDLYMWGYNNEGIIYGCKDQYTGRPYKVLSKIEKVALSSSLAGALTEDKELYVWGTRGVGSNKKVIPSPLKLLENVESFDVTNYTVAAVTSTGELYMWGGNEHGAFGMDTEGMNLDNPIKVKDQVKKVSLGTQDDIFALVTEADELYMWGSGKEIRPLNGEDTREQYETPVLVATNVRDIDIVDSSFIGMVDNNGDLYTWGSGYSLGHGGLDDGEKKKILENVEKINLDDDTGMAITKDNRLYGWGLLSGTFLIETQSSNTPIEIADNVTDVAVTANTYGYVRNDTLYMWGSNSFGEVGIGYAQDASHAYVTEPTSIALFTRDTSVGMKSGLTDEDNQNRLTDINTVRELGYLECVDESLIDDQYHEIPESYYTIQFMPGWKGYFRAKYEGDGTCSLRAAIADTMPTSDEFDVYPQLNNVAYMEENHFLDPMEEYDFQLAIEEGIHTNSMLKKHFENSLWLKCSASDMFGSSYELNIGEYTPFIFSSEGIIYQDARVQGVSIFGTYPGMKENDYTNKLESVGLARSYSEGALVYTKQISNEDSKIMITGETENSYVTRITLCITP